MSKTYYVRINCIGFQDFKIQADSKAAAERKAVELFQCESTEGELCEFLDSGSSLDDGELYVVHHHKEARQVAPQGEETTPKTTKEI